MRGARGKLAGASFGKGQNGQTIQREIKNPNNPNTNPQLYQRAIMATVQRAYNAGKEILDHSFQGLSKGSKCQQKFMRDNLKILRSAIIKDYNSEEPVSQMKARVISRGGVAPMANEYKISEGTLYNNIVIRDEYDCQFKFVGVNEANLTVAGWCRKYGIMPDDIFTICAYLNNPSQVITGEDYSDAAHYVAGSFAYLRFEMKRAAFASNMLISQATLGDIFELTFSLPGDVAWLPMTTVIDVSTWIGGYTAGSAGCIRSRQNSKLRSTENMRLFNMGTEDFGIKTPLILPFWKKGNNPLGNSDLLLEGGNLDGTAPENKFELQEGVYFITLGSYNYMAALYGPAGPNNPYKIPASEKILVFWTYINNAGQIRGINPAMLSQRSVQFKCSTGSGAISPAQMINAIFTDSHAGFTGDVLSKVWANGSELSFLKKCTVMPQYIALDGYRGYYKCVMACNNDIAGSNAFGLYGIRKAKADDFNTQKFEYYYLTSGGNNQPLFALHKNSGTIYLPVTYDNKVYIKQNNSIAISPLGPDWAANGEIPTVRAALIDLTSDHYLKIESDDYHYPLNIPTVYNNLSQAQQILLDTDGVFPVRLGNIYYYVVRIAYKYYLVNKPGEQVAYGTSNLVKPDFRDSNEAPIVYTQVIQQNGGVFISDPVTANTSVSQIIAQLEAELDVDIERDTIIKMWDDASAVTHFPFVF